jgi:K+-sensing histidine kinase KdpD
MSGNKHDPEEVNALLRGVGHKLRGPLGALLGIADMLLYSQHNMDVDVRDDVDRMREHANEALTVVDMVVNLIRIETLDEETSLLDIAVPVRKALNSLQELATSRDRRVLVNLPEGLPWVRGNGEGIQEALQIALELFIRELTMDAVLLSIAVAQNAVVVSIEGGTHGGSCQPISIKDYLSNRKNTDRGLELLLCRRLAEKCGGQFWLEVLTGSDAVRWSFSFPVDHVEHETTAKTALKVW